MVAETTVEQNHCKRVKKAGGLSLKFKSPGMKGVPDRLDLLGLEPAVKVFNSIAQDWDFLGTDEIRDAVRDIIAAAIQFTETKAPGKKPRSDQKRFHARLRKLGFQVNVVDE